MSKKRHTGPSVETQQTVKRRANGQCECCHDTNTNFEIHHRLARSMGGTKNPVVNQAHALVHICRQCHATIEANATWARNAGWKISVGTVDAHAPETVPLTDRWGYQFLLEPDGTRINLPTPQRVAKTVTQ